VKSRREGGEGGEGVEKDVRERNERKRVRIKIRGS